ncbi:hypothetical protein [Pectobacterium carotovorum]|uniref:hypothetical protein n=1 Tax=Pectobacterium brasiliense TaxID=180957 RepID=UPI000B9752D7|nr:hypothetical protein [Pectobacterium carotovorum]OYN57299.1 hypothetical protein B7L52_00995 [Pectobacterium carotovorum]
MSILKKTDNRILAPAWNKSKEAVYSPELRSLKIEPIASFNLSSLGILYHEFINKPTISIAIELLSVAFTENDLKKTKDAAKYILLSNKNMPKTLADFCEKILNDNQIDIHEDSDIFQKIREKRQWLNSNPKDCLCWVDLARLYMSIGEIKSAEKAIIVGFSLSNNNRWVTRVTSRFFFNLDDYERSHQILLKHPSIKTDPWLLASELAISSSYGRNTRLWTNAKKAISAGYSKCHLSELNSSIGTLELNNGAVKKARSYFNESLSFPNGNIFAQAKWAERKADIKGLVPHDILKKHTKAYEAKYWEAYFNKDMKKALSYAKNWIKDEPFSAEPTIHASFIASLLDDYKEVYDISQKGIKIEPNDITLKLNSIFAQFSLEQLEHQSYQSGYFNDFIKKLEPFIKNNEEKYKAHAFANLGLVYYRSGNIEQGRVCYQTAIDIFKKLNNPSLAFAEIINLRESLIANAPWKEDVFKYIERVSTTGGHWSQPLVSYYMAKLDRIRDNSMDWRVKLTAELLRNEGETKKDDSPIKFNLDGNNPTIWSSNKELPKKK